MALTTSGTIGDDTLELQPDCRSRANIEVLVTVGVAWRFNTNQFIGLKAALGFVPDHPPCTAAFWTLQIAIIH